MIKKGAENMPDHEMKRHIPVWELEVGGMGEDGAEVVEGGADGGGEEDVEGGAEGSATLEESGADGAFAFGGVPDVEEEPIDGGCAAVDMAGKRRERKGERKGQMRKTLVRDSLRQGKA